MATDLAGKQIVITGTNTGIGRATAVALARRGAELWMLNRSEERSRAVLDEVGAAGRFVRCDLADLASVRAAADAVDVPRVDVLINNAGLARQKGTTKQGFETTFGVNHLGHFLLTLRLLPKLRAAASARVVTVASEAHALPKAIDWDALTRPTATFTGFPEYGVSKLANVLFSAELARREDPALVRTYALHPGRVGSDVWRGAPWPLPALIRLFLMSNEDGAKPTLYCATSPECGEETGLYYDEGKVRNASRLGRDAALAAELWARSEAWVAGFLS